MSKQVENWLHVMIIDDQEEMRKIIRKLLNSCNIDKVSEAANGKEALGIILQEDYPRPDVYIVDLHMDEMDGMEFIANRRRKKDRAPIILLTGETDEFVLNVVKQAGANHILHKPVSAPELVKAIRAAISAM
ncbi:response regulator transcription factor [Terasakiella sp. SH-1]|uniref:response regulator n=1 Tax=Terasakiella sp. SH-1 TaxID=2560057 RepID=UPI0010743A6F|nr:response regulator transcription factor [Terasakiella sp. SH-1]